MIKSVGSCFALSVAALFSAACEKDAAKSEGVTSSSSAAGDEPMRTDQPAPKASPSGDSVHCLGVHECKGKSACHVVGAHACAGQNDCKGKGWIEVPRTECETKGGKVLDS